MSLKNYIDRWLTARPNRTLSSLSRATEVPLSTLRRIYSREVGAADSKNALPVLAAVCTREEMSAYVNEHYPEIPKFYESLISQNSSPTVKLPNDLNSLFSFTFATDERGLADLECLLKKFADEASAISKRNVKKQYTISIGKVSIRLMDDTRTSEKEPKP